MALFGLKRKDDAGMSGVAPAPAGPTFPFAGNDTWLMAGTPMGLARGQPTPMQGNQQRNVPFQRAQMFGGVIKTLTRQYDRGAAAYVPRFGVPFVNPIGAGVVALNRPLPYYGPAGQYVDHTIFWAQQTIPTSVRLSGLTSPEVLGALLGQVNVQAAVRTV